MTRYKNLHRRTLPHVSGKVRIDGSWPHRVTIGRGWARAFARQWNDDPSAAFLRLDRGGQDFLADATESLSGYGVSDVYSPALYPASTRIWSRAGYEEAHRLRVMERSLAARAGTPSADVVETAVELDELASLDAEAFEGFWRLTEPGLAEALEATTRSSVLSLRSDSGLTGYAIVGSQWGVSYLQRIAVRPSHRGQGFGRDLVRAAVTWARRSASRVMVLNVRDENAPARAVYSKEGFVDTSTHLRILRHAL